MSGAATAIDRIEGHACRRPQAIALVSGATTRTYAELTERAGRWGGVLLAGGAVPGDRVLLALDGAELIEAFLGSLRQGLVPVPADRTAGAEALRRLVRDATPTVIVGAAAIVADSAEGRPIVDPGDDPARATAVPPRHPQPSQFLLYSSGSTGAPKGVVHRDQDLVAVADHYAEKVLGVRPGDRLLSTGRLHHAYGVCNSIAYPLMLGAGAIVLPGRLDLDTLRAALERHRPQLFFSVPAVYHALLALGGDLRTGFAPVRLCLSAAEQLPGDLLRRWSDTVGREILDGIGSTEMLGIFCSQRAGSARPDSSGTPVPGYRMRLVTEDGMEISGPGAGNLEVRGDSAFRGYWGRPELTAGTIRNGWVATRDRFRRDADGRYAYLGRTDDMIKVNGLWVSPLDVEAALRAHPDVHDAAAVGQRYEGLMRVKAYVVLRPGADPAAAVEALRTWCTARLQRHQYPREIEPVPELPRTRTGKVERYRLRTPEPAGADRGL